MKTGDLVRIINPLPDHGASYTLWLEDLSFTGTPVVLLFYNGIKGSWCEIYHDGEAKIAEEILEVVYES